MFIYIAGPMANLPGRNFSTFDETAQAIAKAGQVPVNPVAIGEMQYGNEEDVPARLYLEKDIEGLLKCRGMVLLPNWQNSRGAKLEAAIAKTLKYHFFDYTALMAFGELRRVDAPKTITIDLEY